MKLFTGTANPQLARRIAEYLGVQLGAVDISRFPDGELLVRFKENVRGKDTFIVQSICHPPNETLMELLIMIDAAKRASAARITAVVPFLAYARQDRKDQPRVPITAKLVANLLVAAGTNRVLGMDFHAEQIQGFFDIPVDHLYAMPVIVRYLKERNLRNPIVVAPDSGGVKMAVRYAETLGAGLALGAKYRRGPEEVEAVNVVGDVQGRTAIMVDDLTSTAATLCEAAKLLKQHGANDIYAAVTHAMLRPEGLERLEQSPIRELIVTDSIPLKCESRFPITVLTVAELLGEAILRIHENRSVTSLFKL
ncbi:MAG: ribose-phosphate pyrophosphokinase [Lentisphaerae bacterium]|nr:ribose-phosphate pyrophosphokinase [Lentisphaerota bacterium]